jgi:hypothetical protein
MSSDEFAWGESDDEKQGGITGGFSKRASSRTGKTPNYNDSSDDSDGDADEVQIVAPKSSRKKRASPSTKKSALESSLVDSDENDESKTDASPPQQDRGNVKPAAQVKSSAAESNAKKSSKTEGIDVIIPHSLLNKHQGAGRSECTVLVQVNESDDHQLDFHGQSGAVGRFEADGEGGELVPGSVVFNAPISKSFNHLIDAFFISILVFCK